MPPPTINGVPSNQHAPRRSQAIVIGAALMLSALLTSCSHAAPPPPASPAHIAGLALQDADNEFRTGFKELVAENATNAGGMPCGKSCWHLTHLEKDDTGIISNAYKAATQAYSQSTETKPGAVDDWKAAITAVQEDIVAWGDSADMTRGIGLHSASAQSKALADLDKADALINTFAPDSVRATPVPSAR